MRQNPVMLVGSVVIDATDRRPNIDRKVRLGGIVHAARALWALEVPYHLAYAAPEYLYSDIERYLQAFGAISSIPIAKVHGSPGCMLIHDPEEIGDQGYDLVLGDNSRFEWLPSKLADQLEECDCCVLIPHEQPLADWLNYLPNSHRGIVADLHKLDCMSQTRRLKLVSTSTSSKDAFSRLVGPNGQPVDAVECPMVVKENRGGATLWQNGIATTTGAQLPPTTRNSVGVGDTFIASLAAMDWIGNPAKSLDIASCVASAYAETTYPDEFRDLVKDHIAQITKDGAAPRGTRVPWHSRPSIKLYLAAPDFSYMDRTIFDRIEECAKYHNFTLLRPIMINGELSDEDATTTRRCTGILDRNLLDSADIVVAVPQGIDSGTYVEMGIAAAIGKQVILFDLAGIEHNAMVIATSCEIVRSWEGLISAIFRKASSVLVRRSC